MTSREIHEITLESLRDWFKKEKWVRISSSGNIAGPCGTSKNKKNPDRCLPRAKAQSLTKAQRAATARKKKKAGAKGKTVVKNTKAATVKREGYYSNTQLEDEIRQYGYDSFEQFFADNPGAEEAVFDFIDQNLARMQKETSNPQDGKAAPFGSGYKKVKGMKENIDKLAGGIPYKVKGGKAIITEPLDDATKERIIKRCKDAGYHCAPNQAGGVTIHLKKGTYESKKVTKEDIRNLVVGTLHEIQNEGTIEEKDDRCTRIAKRKYDTWPSAYASGAVVRCRRGEIWKGVKEEVIQESDCKHGRYFCNHDKKYKCRRGPKKSR